MTQAPQRHKISTRAKLIILTAVLASLLEIIDTSIVNVAIPTMMGNLGATLDEISWVITGYIIANAIVLPIASWMSQQIGRKLYYTACVLLFTAASVACGLAPSLPVLVVFRVIQGFAGGALLPTSQALIYEAFPKEMAGMASAIYGMSVMVGPTVGPTLGGYLTDNLGWRSIFNVNLPLGLICAALSIAFVEEVGFDPNRAIERKPAQPAPEASEPKAAKPPRRRSILKPKHERTPVDSIGLGLLITGIGCLQFVLERGHAEDWFASKAIIICSILAVVSLVSLIVWELKTEHPILQLRHFKNQTFRSGILLMTGLGAMLYGLIFLIPIFVSTVQGLTATQTGELFIPGALASAAAMPFIGNQLRAGMDPRKLILVGVLSLAAGVWLISRFNSDTTVEGMFWPLLIRGGAMAYLFVPINTAVLIQFSGAAIGEAAGLLNLCRQLGGSLFIALLSTLFQQYQVKYFSVLATHITPFNPPAALAAHTLAALPHAKLASQMGMATPNLVATQILYFRAKKQAFVLAFERTLGIATVLFLFVLYPLVQLKNSKHTGGPLPDAH